MGEGQGRIAVATGSVFGGKVKAKEVEKRTKITLIKAVDVLGKIVRAALVSSLKTPQPGAPLFLIDSTTYAHQELVAKAVVKLGGSPGSADDPRIENFRGTEMFIEFHEGPLPSS